MKPERGRERRSLRELLATPAARHALRIAGWTLFGLSAVYLILLAVTVLFQPAGRRFTRPEEWLAIGLLALPALGILAAGGVALIRRRRRRK